jgi:hypothetical protein
MLFNLSCGDPVEPKLVSFCDNGYLVNDNQTECICPLETHYELKDIKSDYTRKYCYEKKEYSYLMKIESKSCFKNINFRNGNIGYISFSDDDLVSIHYPDGYQLSHPSIFEFSKAPLSDGSIEFSFKIRGHSDLGCTEWKNKSSCASGIIGYARGTSNIDNTKIDLSIVYIDCHEAVIDSTFMHLWKE